ncbi:uncharacterized protein [Venturia canescens]|uniref:uncharacterized protein n=1 Tax=Venturia canescens TaxID=32260 RepID=UPI001C9C34AC|nr:uncharacterized protein LOC122415857 [Venturia canescens]
MILVNSCCGCISLQKGTIVIGSLSLIGAILNTILMGFHVSEISVPRESPATAIVVLLKIFVVTILIYVLIGGIFSALMIAGAIKRLSGYIFPWLAISFGGVVAGVCLTIAVSIISAIELPIQYFFFLMIFSSVSSAIQIYFWQVVYSHYKELVAEKFGHQTRPSDGKVFGVAPYLHV